MAMADKTPLSEGAAEGPVGRLYNTTNSWTRACETRPAEYRCMCRPGRTCVDALLTCMRSPGGGGGGGACRFRGATSAHRGSGPQGANPGAPAAQRRCSSAPRGFRAQWATAGAHAEQGTWASRTRKRSEAGCGRPEDRGVGTAKTVKRPPQQQPAQSQYANYWAPLTRERHILPQPA